MDLKTMIASIEPVNPQVSAACAARWDQIAKPLNSLGRLEELICRAAAASGTTKVDLSEKAVLVFCADNGVLAQGVAQSTHDVTTAVAQSMLAHTTSVCTMARAAGAQVFPVDMGMVDSVPGMTAHRMGPGTRDLSQGPAMTRAQAEEAILYGAQLAREKAAEGFRLLAVGELGIGNTTTSSAVASVLLDLPVEQVTGRGSGLTNAGLQRKIDAITRGLAVNKPDPADPVDVLSKVGGFDLCAMCGAFLGAAQSHVPAVMDGFISNVAALCAVRLCPAALGYLLPSHETAEPAGKALMQELGFAPMIHGDLRLGEGTGAVALFPLLDLALAVYDHAATFRKIDVEAYERYTC